MIHQGDALEVLKTLPDESVQMCCTSPPYWGLRDYGHEGQIGLERTPEEYVARMVEVFREVRRVLKPDGVLWLNLGDSYATGAGKVGGDHPGGGKQGAAWKEYGPACAQVPDAKNPEAMVPTYQPNRMPLPGLKPKDMVGIPWRIAFALQADGWWLRQDIIWCLSGGTWVYAKTTKGPMPMTIKDMARLKPETVRLWNGEKWTKLLGISKSSRKGDEIELVLRSGERISCTPTHRFPTMRGLVEAGTLAVGDTLTKAPLPEPIFPRDCILDEDAAWFAGLYLAEGSRSGDKIQISGHAKETERWERVKRTAYKFGGSATVTTKGNNQSIRVFGKMLNAIIDELVSGRTSIDKGFSPVVWRYSNRFLAAMVDGYLAGDGYKAGDRWRLGFCRNYNLERDLRTACARLGYTLTLKLSSVKYQGRPRATFRGELRKTRSGHHNERDRNEIVAIQKARCRDVYDLGVEDEPHVFALASGVLTHNSKPNPMPESVLDRCTKAHEYVFLMTKSERYYFDSKAISEPVVGNPEAPRNEWNSKDRSIPGQKPQKRTSRSGNKERKPASARGVPVDTDGKSNGAVAGSIPWQGTTRNKRSVWTITTKPFTEWGEISRQVPVAFDERDGDTKRTTSPDCPVHGDRTAPASNAPCGEREGDLSNHNERTSDRHAPKPSGDSAPTDSPREPGSAVESSDSSRRRHEQPASAHSSGTRRMARVPATTRPCTPSVEIPACIERTEEEHGLSGLAGRTSESNIEQDGLVDHPSAQSSFRNEDSLCSCAYYRTVTEQISHFATFPEELPRLCIMAGSKLGDTVLDPFAGAGTVGAVCEKTGRGFVGIELNPAYVAMAERRIAGVAPLFAEATA